MSLISNCLEDLVTGQVKQTPCPCIDAPVSMWSSVTQTHIHELAIQKAHYILEVPLKVTPHGSRKLRNEYVGDWDKSQASSSGIVIEEIWPNHRTQIWGSGRSSSLFCVRESDWTIEWTSVHRPFCTRACVCLCAWLSTRNGNGNTESRQGLVWAKTLPWLLIIGHAGCLRTSILLNGDRAMRWEKN